MRRVQITFDGLNVACVLCDLVKCGVDVYDVVRCGKRCRLTVAVAHKKAVLDYLTKKCYNITQVKFVGVAAAANFVKNRLCLVIFAVVCLVALYVVGGLCCEIRVDGADEESVVAALERSGVRRFCKMSDIDTDKLENKLAVEMNVAYVLLNKCGATLYVSVKDTQQNVYPVDMHKRRDIVAERDGIVAEVVCLVGTPAVKVGDKVKSGDVLIRGETMVDDKTTPAYAVGRVELRLCAECKVPFDGTITVERQTDEVFCADYVVLFGRAFGKKCPFESFIRTDEVQYLPCGVVVVHARFVRTERYVERAEIGAVADELKRQAEDLARQKADFEVTEAEYEVADDGVSCRLYGVCVCE